MKGVTFDENTHFHSSNVFANLRSNPTARYNSHRRRDSQPKSNYQTQNANNFYQPSLTGPGINDAFKTITQNRMINDSFGQMSENIRDKIKNRKSRFSKLKPRHNSLSVLQVSLPILSSPGSNMSNSFGIRNNADGFSNLSLEPLANAEELIVLNPMNRPNDDGYQKIRAMFFISTFISILIILFEMSAVAVGIIHMNTCDMVDIFLIVSGCFHMIIVILEWSRSWIWFQTENPVVPDSNADHMQVFVSCILLILYSASIVWYTVGFAWIPNVFINHLSHDAMSHDIVIVQNNKTYNQKIPFCQESFYIYSICYQVVVALLFMIRVIMCCMSNFCKMICGKMLAYSSGEVVDDEITNPLHELLPPMRDPLYKWGYQGDRPSTGLSALYNSEKFSIITPIPLYSSDKKVMQDVLVPPL